ncbi:hypothetical protein E2C01_081951 [Portunus trituberculatus]|uniref:Uncharacterized protein n=1 Tax=Portunus trituberculatus TaxID=210409 RepID=A0A5B7IR42_PORTR|nr:hypothetical protein [Portunus trituberculatus]
MNPEHDKVIAKLEYCTRHFFLFVNMREGQTNVRALSSSPFRHNLGRNVFKNNHVIYRTDVFLLSIGEKVRSWRMEGGGKAAIRASQLRHNTCRCQLGFRSQ